MPLKYNKVIDVTFRPLNDQDWDRMFAANLSVGGRKVLEVFRKNNNVPTSPPELGVERGSSPIDQLNKTLRRYGYYVKRLINAGFWQDTKLQIYVHKDVERLRAQQGEQNGKVTLPRMAI